MHLYVLRGSLAVLTSKDDVCQLPSRHSSIRLSSFPHAHLLRSDTHTHSLSHTHTQGGTGPMGPMGPRGRKGKEGPTGSEGEAGGMGPEAPISKVSG